MRTVLLALLLAGAGILPAAAQAGPSEAEQRAACMGDAVRLCAIDIPNRAMVRDCMAAQHDALSPECRAVFDASTRAAGGKLPRQ